MNRDEIESILVTNKYLIMCIHDRDRYHTTMKYLTKQVDKLIKKKSNQDLNIKTK